MVVLTSYASITICKSHTASQTRDSDLSATATCMFGFILRVVRVSCFAILALYAQPVLNILLLLVGSQCLLRALSLFGRFLVGRRRVAVIHFDWSARSGVRRELLAFLAYLLVNWQVHRQIDLISCWRGVRGCWRGVSW